MKTGKLILEMGQMEMKRQGIVHEQSSMNRNFEPSQILSGSVNFESRGLTALEKYLVAQVRAIDGQVKNKGDMLYDTKKVLAVSYGNVTGVLNADCGEILFLLKPLVIPLNSSC